MTIETLVGRQAIYDRSGSIYGYELLFRSATAGVVDSANEDRATATVIVNAFIDGDLDLLVGDRPVFINLTRELILGDVVSALDPRRVVIEVPETIAPELEVVAALRRLSASGYRIALDDFEYDSRLRPLVEVADIVKVDVRVVGARRLEQQRDLLKPYGKVLLAEKVETHEEYRLCRRLGYQYFQGYYLATPDTMRGRRVPSSRLHALHILTRLRDPEASIDEIENMVRWDAALSFKLLRAVNSAAFGLNRRVGSIREALVFLGTDIVVKWVILLLLADLSEKPPALLSLAMVRADMCERLAVQMGSAVPPHGAFLVGLLSVMDALTDSPLEEVVTSLPLSEEIQSALTDGQGVLGQVLRCVLAYERGLWIEAACPGVGWATVAEAYIDAVAWADETVKWIGV